MKTRSFYLEISFIVLCFNEPNDVCMLKYAKKNKNLSGENAVFSQ